MSETIGPYAIDRELGSGGMGKVYAAHVAETAPGFTVGETVALKVVHPHLLQAPGFLERFRREADLGASVHHPNVVRTLGCQVGDVDSSADAHFFMVMEYVHGQTLAALSQELERVPEELCLHIAREVCRGLAAVHSAGIVHRDIKPDNVLITPDHEVKLMDLGVALLMDEAIRLSQTGAFVGSVEYAAPEQFRGDDVDGRTDLYALGILLYEIATGSHPHRGGGFHDVLRRVLEDDPRPIGSVNPQLSPFFEEVVHTLLVKDPRGRFASASQLLSVLEEGEESRWWRDRALAKAAETHRPARRIRIPRETAVYGREKELGTLRGLFARASSGAGQVVLIEGEAGIGKSRLVDELIAQLQRDGEDVNFLFGSYPPNGAATATGAFNAAYCDHFGESGSAEYLKRTPALVPAFDALLRGELAPEGAQRLSYESVPTCFVHATRALAAERVTVVFIDDLHFAPDEGRALFTSLAMAAAGHRVLLIGASRTVVHETWQGDLDRFDFVSRIVPERLPAKELVRLLEDSFKSKALAESVGLQIIVKSDGNPFFAFEIIRGLREGQFIQQSDDGSWVGTRVIEEIRIPSSVLDLVNARVADLSDDERDLVDVACCWGYEFDPGLVGDVLEMRRIPLLKAFCRIERRHRLVRAAGREYVFDHHQVQEALYEGLHEQLREAYHAALAEAYESAHGGEDVAPEQLRGDVAVELCDHFLRGARGERAARYLPVAQRHLGDSYLHAQLATLTERALATPGLLTGRGRAEVLLDLAGAEGPLDLLARNERQEECAREALLLAETAGEDRLRTRAELAIGSALARLARHAESEAANRRALEIAMRAEDARFVSVCHRSVALALWSQGALEPAQEQLERALEIARREGFPLIEASIIGNLGGLHMARGQLADARRAHEVHLRLSREADDRLSEAGALINLGNVDLAEGRSEDAQHRYEAAMAIYTEIGVRRGVAAALGNLGNVLLGRGRVMDAQEQYERYLALSRELGDREGEVRATGNLGAVFWSLGRLDEAQDHFERYLSLSQEIGYVVGEAMALHNQGAVRRDRGDLAASEASMRACLAACERLGDLYLAALAELTIGSLRAERGLADGRAVLQSALEAARAHDFHGLETLALGELAVLDRGHVGAAVDAFTLHRERLDRDERREVCYLLWRATEDRSYLDEARDLVDEAVSQVDEKTRTSMLTNLRLYREIVAACDDRADGAPPGGESPTRVG